MRSSAPTGKPLALAGLWERWKEPSSGQAVQTFTIIKGPPNELVAPIHDRMPVILAQSAWRAWLGEEEVGPDDLLGMLKPFPAELMRAYPVGAARREREKQRPHAARCGDDGGVT